MIWPPSKPISTTTRSALAIGDQLREDAIEGVRMQERDLEAEEALSRPVVDELDTLFLQLVERALYISDLVRDVVHPGPALGEELADGRVLAQRREQLDPSFSDAQRRRLDALLRNRLAMLDARAEDALVRRHRLVEVGDRDAEMV